MIPHPAEGLHKRVGHSDSTYRTEKQYLLDMLMLMLECKVKRDVTHDH